MSDSTHEFIAQTMKALSFHTRVKMMEFMCNSKKKEFTLREIANGVNMRYDSIIRHVKQLEVAGFLQNYLKKHSTFNEPFSFYEITEYGFILFDAIVQGYNKYFGG